MTTPRTLTVITGATGGIGSAIARRLAGGPNALYLFGGRNAARLAELTEELGAPGRIADLTAPDGRDALFGAFETWAASYPLDEIDAIRFVGK